MEYVIIGMLIIIIIISVISLMKNINESNISERLGKLETSMVKEIGEFKNGLSRDLNDDFTKLNDQIDSRLRMINDKVNERLDQNFEKTNKTFASVLERLSKIDEAQKKIDTLSNDIVSLQSVLTDKKARGIFGEVNLKHILSSVFGDNNKHIYQLQYSFENGVIADCVLFAPEPLGKIAIDSKFPLENYRRLVEKGLSEREKEERSKVFESDVKKHIDAISSKYIIPGGDTLVLEVNSKGLVVVGFYNVNGNQINDDLKIGDRIIKVNDISINKISDLNKLIKKYDKDELFITYVRNDKEYEDKLEVLLSNGTYKTGLYVKESVLGIGTLTYIDPSTGVYGILGHSLNLSQTNQKFVVKDGFSYEAVVTNFIKSNNGNPGSKNADIDKDNVFGTVEVNTDYGVFGIIDEDTNKGLLEVGDIDDIKVGVAYIRTTNEKNEVINYEINIIEVNENNTDKFYDYDRVNDCLALENVLKN